MVWTPVPENALHTLPRSSSSVSGKQLPMLGPEVDLTPQGSRVINGHIDFYPVLAASELEFQAAGAGKPSAADHDAIKATATATEKFNVVRTEKQG